MAKDCRIDISDCMAIVRNMGGIVSMHLVGILWVLGIVVCIVLSMLWMGRIVIMVVLHMLRCMVHILEMAIMIGWNSQYWFVVLCRNLNISIDWLLDSIIMIWHINSVVYSVSIGVRQRLNMGHGQIGSHLMLIVNPVLLVVMGNGVHTVGGRLMLITAVVG